MGVSKKWVYNRGVKYPKCESEVKRNMSSSTVPAPADLSVKCPKCESEVKQHKVGKTSSGSQRYRCYQCKYKYTPEKKPHSYDEKFKKMAIQLYLDGMSFRRVARHLGVDPQSVANWVKAHTETLPDAPVP